MSMNRREFLGVAAGAAAAAFALPRIGFAQVERQSGPFFDWKVINDHARVAMGAGGNALVVSSANRILLIDCKNFGYGYTLRREAQQNGGALEVVVNTHHHGDHTGGNHVFARTNSLVAHKNAKPRILANASSLLDRHRAGGEALWERLVNSAREQGATQGGAERTAAEIQSIYHRLETMEAAHFAPTTTFDLEHTIAVGAVTAQLRHAGPGHTDNDAYIFIPELNLLHTGDLVFNNLHPFFDAPAGATSEGWMRSCDAMLNLCDADTIVVPGHGEITDRGGIVKQKRYFQLVRDAVGLARKQGKTRDEAVAIDIPELADYGFTQIKERTFGAIYNEMQ